MARELERIMKKRMKTVFAGILVLAMLLVPAGCGADEGKQAKTPGESVSAESSDSIQQESAPGETETRNETPDTTQVAPSQNDAVQENTENSSSLVVYFSRTGEQYGVGKIDKGNTAIVADMIIDKTGADSFEILPEEDVKSLCFYTSFIHDIIVMTDV